MTAVDTVGGPFWGGREARHAGRYPLAVERHVVAQVGRLLPGVTAVTPAARYYTLHAVVAEAVRRRKLVAVEAQDLLRRCEVVMASISLAHGPHPGMAEPHGADRLRAAVQSGTVDVAELSQPGGYATGRWGFWGPYRGSEALLGLAGWESANIIPGPDLPMDSVWPALEPIVELASQDGVDLTTLRSTVSGCVCACADAADGQLLRSLLLPGHANPQSNAGRRVATIQMMLRILQMDEIKRVTADMWPIVAYDDWLADDHVCGPLEVVAAWRGVVLRARSVLAWRDMWADLVNSIEGLATTADLAQTFADAMPDETVRSYRDGLPDVGSGAALLPAEQSVSVSGRHSLDRSLALLVLGGARVGQLPGSVAAYFEDPSEAKQELTPSWISARVAEWERRSVHDFVRWLTGVLVARSQRIALRKAAFDKASGTFQIPSRMFVRDGLLFRDSNESGGPLGFRWDPLASVLVGAGLCRFDSPQPGQIASRFSPTDRALEWLS